MAKKIKNSNWFEAFCMMDEVPDTSKTKKKTGDRVRVENRANTPYGQDDEIPPFDDTPSEPIREDIIDDAPKPAAKRSTSSGKKSTTTKASSASSKSGNKKSGSSTGRQTPSGKTSARGKTQDKPLPADIAYRLQPYLLLFFGGLLLIMLFLSVVEIGRAHV